MAKVLAISSQVVFGPVGLNCIVPALQASGHDVLALPTVLLSNHPGHGKPVGHVVTATDLTKMCEALAAIGAFKDIGAVITGYFASAEQVVWAAKLIATLHCPVVLVDPVLGDDGKLYVSDTVAGAIRDHLLPLASITTPNAFELSWLTGTEIETLDEAIGAARKLQVETVIVTSLSVETSQLATVHITPEQVTVEKTEKLTHVPNGTGDMLAGLYLAQIMDGQTIAALPLALGHLQHAIELSTGTALLAVAAALRKTP